LVLPSAYLLGRGISKKFNTAYDDASLILQLSPDIPVHALAPKIFKYPNWWSLLSTSWETYGNFSPAYAKSGFKYNSRSTSPSLKANGLLKLGRASSYYCFTF